MEEQEKSYEVHDRRRVNEDGELREEAVQAEEPVDKETTQQAFTGDETSQGDPQDIPEMPDFDVYALLGMMIGSLADKAWECMGIRLPAGAKEVKKDMEQAKLAVDTVAFLVEKLNPKLSDEEKKMTEMLVSDLKINFVKQKE